MTRNDGSRSRRLLADLRFRCRDCSGLDCFLVVRDDSIGSFIDHLFQEQSQMRVWPVVGRRDVFDAIGVG